MDNSGIIDRLKYIIREMGLTQGEFAQRIGVDSSNLSKYLNGRLAVNDSLINRIVVNLGISKEWITSGTDLPYSKQPAATPSDALNLHGTIRTTCRLGRVSGDSMQPGIRSGDFIAVRELSNLQQIFWGQIYVVVLDDYCMVKYVRRHENPDWVILRSENPNYDDMEVRRTDIRDMMFVQHIMHVDTRM